MSADIVERLERLRNARTFPFYEDGVLREAAAEIVRLRGEVERIGPGSVVSASELSRMTRATFDHSGAKIDPSYRQSTAPAEAKGDNEPLASQIDRLAKFILANFPGEPSTPDGAIDVAIRLLTPQPADGGTGGYFYWRGGKSNSHTHPQAAQVQGSGNG